MPCGTFHQTAIKGADASGNSVETDTEIIDDGAGNLLATDVTVTTRFISRGFFLDPDHHLRRAVARAVRSHLPLRRSGQPLRRRQLHVANAGR